jgi:5-hydroxyisourate hydrolase
MSLSTHVLDATTGRPAAGVPLRLSRSDGTEVAAAVTDAGGRHRFAEDVLTAGTHRLTFDTAAWSAFYPEVVVTFTVSDPAEHHHVPLLLSPYAYSTYRGS